MPYYKIAESKRYDITVELYEQAEDDPGLEEEMFVLDFIERKGVATVDKYKPHLPYEVQIPVLDVNRFFLGRIRNYALNKFRIKAYDPSATLIGEWYVNTRFSKQNFAKVTNVLPLVGFDGITLLKRMSPVTTLQPIGQLIETLLHMTGITPDVLISSDIHHRSGSGQNNLLINQVRTDPSYFIRGIDNPSAYDQLMAILELFKFQVFQENGVWRVMEREARRSTSMNVFNITQNSVSTLDPTFTLEDSQLRSDPDEDYYDPITSLRRVADRGYSSYEFNNGDFDTWNADLTQLLGWDVRNQLTIDRILESGQVGFQFNTFSTDAYMSQQPFFPLYWRDRLRFRFNAKFEWDALQQPDSTRRVNIARIRLLGNNNSVHGLNTLSKSFELGHDGVIYDQIDTNSFNIFVSFDFDFEVEMPARGLVMIELFFTGDVQVVNVYPKFFAAALEAVEVQNKPMTRVISFVQSMPGRRISETVRVDDPFQYVHPADFQYFDGSEWNDITLGWEDYDGDAFIDPINNIVAMKMIESGLSFDHILDVPINYNTDVKLFNTIIYTLDGQQRKYVPILIERKRKAKQARLLMLQIKNEAAPKPEIIYK